MPPTGESDHDIVFAECVISLRRCRGKPQKINNLEKKMIKCKTSGKKKTDCIKSLKAKIQNEKRSACWKYIENMIFDIPVSDSDEPFSTKFPKKLFSYIKTQKTENPSIPVLSQIFWTGNSIKSLPLSPTPESIRFFCTWTLYETFHIFEFHLWHNIHAPIDCPTVSVIKLINNNEFISNMTIFWKSADHWMYASCMGR